MGPYGAALGLGAECRRVERESGGTSISYLTPLDFQSTIGPPSYPSNQPIHVSSSPGYS